MKSADIFVHPEPRTDRESKARRTSGLNPSIATPRAELLGRKMHDVIHFRHPAGTPFPAEECGGLRVLRDAIALTDHEDFFIRKDGSFIPVVYTFSAIVYEGKIGCRGRFSRRDSRPAGGARLAAAIYSS